MSSRDAGTVEPPSTPERVREATPRGRYLDRRIAEVRPIL
jgi:hypothetical protein